MERFERPPDLHELSQKYTAPERQETAKVIKAERSSYFIRKEKLRKNLEELGPLEKAQGEQLADSQAEVEQVESMIQDRASSLIKKIFNYREIRGLSGAKSLKEYSARQEQASYDRIISQITQLEHALTDRTELERAKTILAEFRNKQHEEYPVLKERQAKDLQEKNAAEEKDRLGRRVETLMEQYQSIFIHGLHAGFTPQGNSLLRENMNWRTKLNVALCLRPTISTSAIRKGDTSNYMWARSGLLVTGGSVIEGHGRDGGTRAKAVNSRHSGYSGRTNLESIRSAVWTHYDNSYNELVVESPKVAGIYIYQDRELDPMKDHNDLPPVSEIIKAHHELGLPIYIVNTRGFFEAQITPEGTLKENKSVDAKDLIGQEVVMDDKARILLEREVFEDSPLDVRRHTDFICINSSARGRELYIKQAMVRQRERLEKVAQAKGPEKILSEFNAAGERVTIKLTKNSDGRTNAVSEWVDSRTGRVWANYLNDSWNMGGHEAYINLGLNTWRMELAYSGIKEYIRSMEATLGKLDKDIAKEEKQSTRDFYLEIKEALLFHLYGFALQAEETHDQAAASAATTLAKSHGMTEEKYQALFARRIGPNGAMKITPEDLQLEGAA